MESKQLVLYWARIFHQAFQLNQSGVTWMGRGCFSVYNRTQMFSQFPWIQLCRARLLSRNEAPVERGEFSCNRTQLTGSKVARVCQCSERNKCWHAFNHSQSITLISDGVVQIVCQTDYFVPFCFNLETFQLFV